MRRSVLPLVFVVIALLMGGACGDDGGGDSGGVAADVAGGDAEIVVGDDLEEKPEIEIDPPGFDATSLEIVDVVEGDGAEVEEGSMVSVDYVGVLTDGEQFDASWDRGEPVPFTVGAGEVIPGWDEGLVGMKQGGRRLLVIPPALAYGPEGTPGGPIGPDATLVFVVDLVDVS